MLSGCPEPVLMDQAVPTGGKAGSRKADGAEVGQRSMPLRTTPRHLAFPRGPQGRTRGAVWAIGTGCPAKAPELVRFGENVVKRKTC